MRKNRLAVIGGGASGLSAAIEAKVFCPEIQVTVFEKLPKAGKKLLATGNGRCNFSNEDLSPRHFHGNNGFLRSVLSSPFADDETFFRESGILPYFEEGRLYPHSQQASSLRDALVNRVMDLGVEILYDSPVTELKSADDDSGFIVNGKVYDSIIICGGGKASPAQGSDGSCYPLAKSFGHHTTELRPALCGLTTQFKQLKLLKGVRCEGNIALISNGTVIGEDKGEIQFTDKGISGIPIMNLSYLCEDFGDLIVSLDLCSDITQDELSHHIADFIAKYPLRRTEDLLSGIVNNKIGYAIMDILKIKNNLPSGKLSRKQVQDIKSIMKAFDIKINGTRGFENAQVTAGGINTSEINPKTMMSTLREGLFFAGEIVDIHGDCGGYNLHLAWTTGRIAGNSASEFLKNKV